MPTNTKAVAKRRITTSVGAVIEGVDLREALAPGTVQALREALLEHGVIFFKNQNLSDQQMKAFVSQLGTPIPEPFGQTEQPRDPVGQSDFGQTKRSTSVWHSDTTFVTEPPGMTALRAVRPPEFGGDTCWSSMYAAYEALSEPMRRLLDGLTAVHSMVPVLQRMGSYATDRIQVNERTHGVEHVHPVVRVHPETGRKALFVNEGWTTRIVELEPAESAHILAMLFEHVKSPDFMMRWHWVADDLALWDNCSVQHYAVPDYSGERIMQRVVLSGDRPRGPAR
jgi:alpha-ketoglutarate-dependent taurine dioxygenase